MGNADSKRERIPGSAGGPDPLNPDQKSPKADVLTIPDVARRDEWSPQELRAWIGSLHPTYPALAQYLARERPFLAGKEFFSTNWSYKQMTVVNPKILVDEFAWLSECRRFVQRFLPSGLIRLCVFVCRGRMCAVR